MWVTAFFQNFGHKTSNVVESQNSVLNVNREMSILELFDSI